MLSLPNKLFFFLCAGFLLVGCGNQHTGLDYKGYPLKTSSSAAGSYIGPTINAPGGHTFGNCQNTTVYAGSDASYSHIYDNSTLCPGLDPNSQQRTAMARLRVSGSFPGDTFCLIPLNGSQYFSASCFALNGNGQIDLVLSSANYTAIALVRASEMPFLLDYFDMKRDTYPPLAWATLP